MMGEDGGEDHVIVAGYVVDVDARGQNFWTAGKYGVTASFVCVCVSVFQEVTGQKWEEGG